MKGKKMCHILMLWLLLCVYVFLSYSLTYSMWMNVLSCWCNESLRIKKKNSIYNAWYSLTHIHIRMMHTLHDKKKRQHNIFEFNACSRFACTVIYRHFHCRPANLTSFFGRRFYAISATFLIRLEGLLLLRSHWIINHKLNNQIDMVWLINLHPQNRYIV